VTKEKARQTYLVTSPDAQLVESERAELVRLRAESRDDKSTIAELRMQVEFAKKVATWFARGSQ
jgi:transposase